MKGPQTSITDGANSPVAGSVLMPGTNAIVGNSSPFTSKYISIANPTCRKLFWQWVRRAALRDKYQAKKQLAEEEPVIVEYAKSFFPVLFLVFFLRSFLVEPFQIPSESMVPTLEVGDFILVNKYAYGVRLPLIRTKVIDISEPKRGDVMVFFPPKEERYFIKRVVGLPGDQIKIADNQLFINGVKQEQTLIDSSTPKPGEPCAMEGGTAIVVDETFGDKSHKMRKCVIYGRPLATRSWTVPQGHYFMMGDNRDNSADSRSWGTVPEERIVGKAFAIWMHWEKLLSIPSFSRVGTI